MLQLTRRLPPAFLALVAASFLLACGDGEANDEPARAMQLSMRDIAYSTTTLTASNSEHIRIELDNQGQLTHDFTVDRIPVSGLHTEGGATGGEHEHAASANALHLALEGGKQGWLEFEPTEAGTYEFYCTVTGHRDAGMRGTLTVH